MEIMLVGFIEVGWIGGCGRNFVLFVGLLFFVFVILFGGLFEGNYGCFDF